MVLVLYTYPGHHPLAVYFFFCFAFALQKEWKPFTNTRIDSVVWCIWPWIYVPVPCWTIRSGKTWSPSSGENGALSPWWWPNRRRARIWPRQRPSCNGCCVPMIKRIPSLRQSRAVYWAGVPIRTTRLWSRFTRCLYETVPPGLEAPPEEVDPQGPPRERESWPWTWWNNFKGP